MKVTIAGPCGLRSNGSELTKDSNLPLQYQGGKSDNRGGIWEKKKASNPRIRRYKRRFTVRSGRAVFVQHYLYCVFEREVRIKFIDSSVDHELFDGLWSDMFAKL